MATSSFGVRKPKNHLQKSSVKSDCPFSVNRGPITTQKRDVTQFEDYKQRSSLIERMKDAFRTISFRSEPTIGEDDLNRRNYARTPVNGKIVSGIGYPVVEKRHEELVQNLVPDCYEHIQNFHHYRSDMERLDSGFKVLYLTTNDKLGKGEKELRRVYGQTSAKTDCREQLWRGYGFGKPRHFQMPRKPKSTMVTMVSKKCFTPSQKVRAKTIVNTDKNGQTYWKQKLDCSGALSNGKDFKSSSANSTELSLNNNTEQRLSCGEDGIFNGNDHEVPSVKLEHATSDGQTTDIQRSFHSLCSADISPKTPMTTPDIDMSRRSSVRTLLFESQDDLVKSDGNSPRNFTTNKDSIHSPHYLAPFQSRFPHLKSYESTSSFQMRQKRGDSGFVPPWQQYRILCDAFRPTISPERFPQQKNYQPNGYRKPKFATATELEYYIDIVSETNSNSVMYLS